MEELGIPKVQFERGGRVGVILSSADRVFQVLGFGTYEGEVVPSEEAVGPMTDFARVFGVPVPKLQLDNGDVVYGSECYWGDEAGLLEVLSGEGIMRVDVDIKQVRAEFRRRHGMATEMTVSL